MSTSLDYLPNDLYYATFFEWENASVKLITDDIWDRGFRVIAEANNILQEVEKLDDSFFEYGENEKNMIIGEMYAIRAFMHFDLFRLFCSSSKSDISSRMPYVTVYPDKQPEHKNKDKVLEEIIRDMEKAKEILAPVDTIFCRKWITSLEGRFMAKFSGSSAPNDFVNYRGARMNYFGVTALLARIYLYQENMEKAYENAKHIVDNASRFGFSWTDSFYQGELYNIDYIYTKRPTELLLAFSNRENYNNWERATNSNVNYLNMKNMDELFGSDTDDYRKKGWYNWNDNRRYLTWIRPTGTDYTPQVIANDQGPLLPVIRLSEMYHILIEYYIQKEQKSNAIAHLNTVRINRGAKTQIPAEIEYDALFERLVNDIIRETLTEGQTFYLFKRLNRSIYNGTVNITMKPTDWIIPIPDSETSYQH